MPILSWIRKSFYRQVMSLLLAGGLSLTTVYGYFDYVRERDQLQDMVEADVLNLANTLSLVIADDIFYEKYFELWNRINAVYRNNHSAAGRHVLYSIREISVVNKDDLIVAHSDPDNHPLLAPDEHSKLDGRGDEADGEVLFWINDAEPLLVLRMPVLFGDERVGVIALQVDPQPMLEVQNAIITRYIMFEIVLLIILVLSARFLARWLSRPVEQASNVLSLLGTGTVNLPELKSRHDELKRLGVTIENADHRIHASNVAARDRQNELESHVQDRTREIESFTYSVSHDLRSPLRAMDGFSQALLEDYGDELDDTAKNYLQRIRGASERMGDLIDDLLMLSSVNRKDLKHESMDLTAMGWEIVEELREEFPHRKVDIVIKEEMRVRGDTRLMRIALRNLLGNAWKYTEKTPEARVEFGRKGGTFYVRDNGTGFDMKYVHKLFEAFQRLHGRDDYEGTGIGLAIVQRIISRHHGEVWAESEPGQGATFYFHLGDGENVSRVA